jgi:predicted dehydrogenase
MQRRAFLRQVAAAGAAGTFAPYSRALGANGDIRVAVVGFRSQGRVHIKNYLKMPGVRVVALCDCDRAILDQQVRNLDSQGVKVASFVDIRKLLDQKDVDAISVVTPNHWHALATVWACQAGKDVDVEKPVSHNIWEGRKMVEAARKYHRIVQADLDIRSSRSHDRAIEYLRSGQLGTIQAIRAFNYKFRPSIGKTEGQGYIPETLDYDLWCGPAKKGPINRSTLHYDWHWVWNTGGGEIANNGPHWLDLSRWVLGEKGLARRVMSLGGRFGYDDAGETPNTMIALFDYASAPVIFEVRGLPGKPGNKDMSDFSAATTKGRIQAYRRNRIGDNLSAIVQCEGGYVDFGCTSAFDYKGNKIIEFDNSGTVDPQSNFIGAVRSRKLEDIKTDIAEGHVSTSLCHMGNISYRLGASSRPEAVRERMQGDRDGMEAFGRLTEHLAAHGIDLNRRLAVLGPWLSMDSSTERFTGPLADHANADLMMRREFRAPYVIGNRV